MFGILYSIKFSSKQTLTSHNFKNCLDTKTEKNIVIKIFPNFITNNIGILKQNITKRGKTTKHFQLPKLPLNKDMN